MCRLYLVCGQTECLYANPKPLIELHIMNRRLHKKLHFGALHTLIIGAQGCLQQVEVAFESFAPIYGSRRLSFLAAIFLEMVIAVAECGR